MYKEKFGTPGLVAHKIHVAFNESNFSIVYKQEKFKRALVFNRSVAWSFFYEAIQGIPGQCGSHLSVPFLRSLILLKIGSCNWIKFSG